jgi:hypothetical protein
MDALSTISVTTNLIVKSVSIEWQLQWANAALTTERRALQDQALGKQSYIVPRRVYFCLRSGLSRPRDLLHLVQQTGVSGSVLRPQFGPHIYIILNSFLAAVIQALPL